MLFVQMESLAGSVCPSVVAVSYRRKLGSWGFPPMLFISQKFNTQMHSHFRSLFISRSQKQVSIGICCMGGCWGINNEEGEMEIEREHKSSQLRVTFLIFKLSNVQT